MAGQCSTTGLDPQPIPGLEANCLVTGSLYFFTSQGLRLSGFSVDTYPLPALSALHILSYEN